MPVYNIMSHLSIEDKINIEKLDFEWNISNKIVLIISIVPVFVYVLNIRSILTAWKQLSGDTMWME